MVKENPEIVAFPLCWISRHDPANLLTSSTYSLLPIVLILAFLPRIELRKISIQETPCMLIFFISLEVLS
uniref:Uncharacterized protein n=1 Tax=Arundo donax TaxID=35708 RepID=A0A0A9C9S6_ARUDO